MQYASQNLIPVTLELGGKSPNVFFEDVALHNDDAYYDKALEGFTMFALNQGEVCTCPSRSLIQRSIYDQFLGDGLERVKKVRQGNPLDPETMIGAQASNDPAREDPVVHRHRQAGWRQAAHRWGARRPRRRPVGRLLRRPDRVRGHERHAHLPGGDLRPRAVGHVVRRLRRRHLDRQRHALRLGRGRLGTQWRHRLPCRSRDRGGPVWTNTYHQYPAHAAFGGYKQSGIGRENHLKMLDHYQQTKNLLVSYADGAMGFF